MFITYFSCRKRDHFERKKNALSFRPQSCGIKKQPYYYAHITYCSGTIGLTIMVENGLGPTKTKRNAKGWELKPSAFGKISTWLTSH